jgi:hypothetical protein
MANARKLCLSQFWECLNKAAGHLGDAIWIRQEGANHSDRVCTGFNGVAGVRVSDAPDCNEGKRSDRSANRAKSVQTEDWKSVTFTRRRKNRTNGQIVERQVHGLERLVDIVSRIPDDRSGTEEFSSCLRGKIVLTEMNAAGAGCKGDIDPIIDYQLHSASLSNSDRRSGLFIKLQSLHPLLSELNQRRTALAQ